MEDRNEIYDNGDDYEELIAIEDFESLTDEEINDLLKVLEEGENNEWRFRTKKFPNSYLYSW